ncbi:molybdate ABC transporter substrate-binding protein [Pseudaminobacter sp. 19-2017]|uniref:Molybdate ABC transporter substrate-binding protein n=1 Tax=Pseudaminobacter soli (ex Zhang et al. 2022) TaxID=2831468 RepID=A0A942IAW5_9HYPH|nr:molybdate ABC transporter substrate-binding protein [Pseudaminobacter soli]MBS3651710.1 molybdate ABC transporter substrate-binding protein [Pseudaminobacter soli]
MRAAAILALASLLITGSAQAAEPIKLLAAGSLKAAMTDIGKAFSDTSGVPVEAGFGASGLLRERIIGGEEADVFASANLEHPQAIADKRGLEVRPFARNTLCALVQPDIPVSGDNLLERMLDPTVKVGTSTPKADPSGDYAWELFDKAEAIQAGAAETLKAKALQLTGGPDSPKPATDRSDYGWVMEEKQADIFLTYCTNAVIAAAEMPGLRVVGIPDELAVGADYGLVVLSERAEGKAFADFILSDKGQAILESYGFGPPRNP